MLGLEHPVSLRVGIDLDGCPYDYVAAIRDAARLAKRMIADGLDLDSPEVMEFVMRLDPEPPATHWHFYEDWGITGPEFAALNRWAMEHAELFVSQPLDEAWGQALVDLKEAGHTLHVVTHRSLPGALDATERWLQANHIDDLIDSVHLVRNVADKAIVECDVLIDDKVENVQSWEEAGRTAIVYDRPWNSHYHGNAIRVFNPAHLVAAIGTVSRWRGATVREFISDDGEHAIIHSPDVETILEEAQRLVHGDRGQDYGHPIVDFARTGAIWGAILDEWRRENDVPLRAVPPQLVSLCMVGLKISREVNRPKRDNRVDGAGYFETLDMVATYQETHATVPS